MKPDQPNHASMFAPGGEISPGMRGGMFTSDPHLTNELMKPPIKVVQIMTLGVFAILRHEVFLYEYLRNDVTLFQLYKDVDKDTD
ncbi:hypothetical protein [Neisseria sicca]|uniref:hypothetical protein n=1 Tax=Neisseria sicca TaxID=490 RepID=UPI00037EE80A|nr:hypothetical protein [Neisseria sicca]